MAMKRILALAALALLVAACDKDKDVAPPAELVDFNPVVRIDKVWSVGTKGGDDVLRLGLRPAVEGERERPDEQRTHHGASIGLGCLTAPVGRDNVATPFFLRGPR